jgi:hypothetical protein
MQVQQLHPCSHILRQRGSQEPRTWVGGDTGWIVERKAEPRPVFSGFLQELSSRAPILQFLAAAR